MFEMHGWITVVSWKIPHKEAIKLINSQIQFTSSEAFRLTLSSINSDVITISVISSKDRGYLDKVKELVNTIFNLATLSYGLVYYLVDNEGNDRFEVLIIRKNTIEVKRDVWLSPYFPMIDD